VVELAPKKETFLLKLFFAGQLGREAVLAQLKMQRELHLRQLAYYRTCTAQEVAQAAAQHPDFSNDAVLWEATRRFGEMYEELYARWIEETVQLVEEKVG
jgi:hypothetical protein